MTGLVVRAPAKVNLALAVTGTQDNGYHKVDMLMQAVSLFETVEIVKSSGYFLRLPQSPVPANEKNTATKAAAAFFMETGLLAGADITIHKTVPTRAGLAGGSADAAAVLVGLNALYGAKLNTAQLCKIGLEVGADVPFSILGGTARAQGIGEKLSPISPLPACWFAIAMPTGGVSTPMAYKKFDEIGSPLSPDISAACAAINSANLKELAPHMQNMLQCANGDETTQLLCQTMRQNGALAAMMTGSGSAVFGMFLNQSQAKAAASAAKAHAQQVFCVQPVQGGPQLVKQY